MEERKVRTLSESVEVVNSESIEYVQIQGGYQVEFTQEKKEKTMSALLDRTDIDGSRITEYKMSKLLDTPNTTIYQWVHSRRTPPTSTINLIEYWLKNEGYLKREFEVWFEAYDEITREITKCTEEIQTWIDSSGETHTSSGECTVYADSIKEAVEKAVALLIEHNKSQYGYDSVPPVVVQTAKENGMTILLSQSGLTYADGEEPLLTISQREIFGMKQNGMKIEYYKIVKDSKSESGHKYILAKTQYVTQVYENVLVPYKPLKKERLILTYDNEGVSTY